MAGSAAKVVISERQQEVPRKLSTATTVAKRLVRRATILPLAFSGVANQDIAQGVGLGRLQVGIWRRRWQDAFPNLIRVECPDDPLPCARPLRACRATSRARAAPASLPPSS
jgi:putative transposase